MDIKEIAEQVSKRIYVEDGLLLSKFISEKFAEVLISAYKAELLKEVGEPVAARRKVAMWRGGDDYKYEWEVVKEHTPGTEPLFTSDQVAAAILKATKPLEDQLEIERMRLAACSTAALGYFDGCCDEYKSASLDDVLRLRQQLKAAQEGIKKEVALSDSLKMAASMPGTGSYIDWIKTIRNSHDQLAKAEQRVAEAIADYISSRVETDDDADLDVRDVALLATAGEIRSGEWRKFLKGE